MQLLGRRSTHAAKLERWLGADEIENISRQMKDWYGPPIALHNVPGAVFARGGGDFVGPIEGGGAATLKDFICDRATRKFRRFVERQSRTMHSFSSLSDLISEATSGKRREFFFNKTGSTGVAAATNSLWNTNGVPPTGAAAGSAPGGTVTDDATTGAFPFVNPTGGDTHHLVSAMIYASVAANSLLFYDRIFHVNKTMNSAATEAVTGVPNRYQNTTQGAVDSIEGNFLFIVSPTALAATAHNWTVCTYLDQANAASTLPSVTGNASNIANRLDMPTQTWFCPLETGDRGIKALTQMQCSAAVATGTVEFVIGHPLAFFPCPIANLALPWDGINSAFSLVRIFDDACLTFLEMLKPSTTATTYTGQITTVAG